MKYDPQDDAHVCASDMPFGSFRLAPTWISLTFFDDIHPYTPVASVLICSFEFEQACYIKRTGIVSLHMFTLS